MNLKFTINGETADFTNESDLTPRITKRLFDVEEIDIKGGDYTLNLNLPRTKLNSRLFGFLDSIQTASTLYSTRRYKAAIELDGDLLIQGTLSIDEINRRSFKCTLIGDNIDFAEKLDQLSLRDIPNFTKPLWSGPASPAYNPFPNQYPGSEGYWENWWTSPLNSANENTGNEFCLPLISYGNFPAPATYTPYATRTAAEGEFHFYNTASTRLSATSIMPCPYFVTTIRKIFEAQGYNVAGDYFTKSYYKNDFTPFVGDSKPEWNYGLLGRLDIEYTSVNNGFIFPIIYRTVSGTANVKPLDNTVGIYRENTFDDSRIITLLPTVTRHVFYWRPFFSDLSPKIDSTVVTTVINENYLFDETYLNDTTALGNNQARSYIAPATGTYRVEFSMDGIGGQQFFGSLSNNAWFKSNAVVPLNNFGFYLMIVKRSALDTNPNFLGADGNGFVDILDPTYPLALDPNVLAFNFYDVTTGMYDGTGGPGSVNLEIGTMTLSITADVEVNELDTIEVMMAFCLGTNLYNSVKSVQAVTIDDGSLITWKVTPLDLPIELNPAKFLPDITQAEFLKTVINTNNLYLFYDRLTNTVYLNEYDNYFLSPSTAIDWSDKCSLDDDSVTLKPILQYKEVQFALTTDTEDRLVELFGTPTGYTYSNLSDYYTEIKEITLGYSPTVSRDYIITDDTGAVTPNKTKIDIPTLCNPDIFDATLLELDNGDATRGYGYNWRRCKYSGIKPISFSKSLFIGDVAFSIYDGILGTKFFYPYAVVQTTDWNPTFQGVNNLYLNYWTKWINLLQYGTLISLDVYLRSSDITNLDIRRPIQIGNDLFIINSIEEFNPSEDTLTKINIYKK